MGPAFNTSRALSEIARASHPLAFADDAEYDPLIADIGDARLVLIGEASHGTHDFYRERVRITRRLIREKGFAGVAVEGDWPDSYQVNRFVTGQGVSDVAQPVDALAGFRRFPAWMWRNMDVLAFVEWLRNHNATHDTAAGFFGLDLYSLYASAQEVLHYLDANDAAAAARARSRYGCFDQFGEDTQAYGYSTGFGMTENCERAVVDQLVEFRRNASALMKRDGASARGELFSAMENAQVVHDAERYYRTMFGGRVSSWNLRDRHMAETLNRLLEHLGAQAKLVVWAHNSHLGDARATEMGRIGELNLGQLVRQHYGHQAYLLGFTTNSGEVTAASNWDEPAERKIVRRALPTSIEALFHTTGLGDFLLPLRDPGVHKALNVPMLERAIGVIYRPETERVSHYFEANVPEQFDAVIHIDRTRSLIPLETSVTWHHGEEVPETYPSAV